MKRNLLLIIFAIVCFSSVFAQEKRNKLFERKETYVDIRDQLKLYVKILDKNKTPVEWQTVVEERECDMATLLPDGNYLFGLTDMTSNQWGKVAMAGKYDYFPALGTLCKVDSKTGKVLWQYKREGKAAYSDYHVVAASDNAIVVQTADKKSSSITAIDLQTGKAQWTRKVESNAKTCATYDGNTLLIYYPVKTGWQYESISLADNRQLTKPRDASVFRLDSATVEPFDDRRILIASGNSVVLLDAASGEVSKNLTTASPLSKVYPFTDRFLVAENDGKSRMYNVAGEQIWEIFDRFAALLYVIEGDQLYRLQPSESDLTLQRLDANNGTAIWNCPLDGLLYSDIFFGENRIAFTTENSFSVVDIQSGKMQQTVALPINGSRNFDKVQQRGSHWIVAQEKGVTAYSASLQPLWNYSLTNNGIQSKNDCLAALTGRETESLSQVKAGNFTYSPIKLDYSTVQSQQNAARWHQEYNRNPSSYTRTMSQISSQFAANHIMINQAMQRIETSIGMAMMTYEMGQMGAQIGAAVAAERQADADRQRNSFAYTMNEREYKTTVQDKYYIRRFETGKSVNLLVVNLDTGAWAELVLSPREGAIFESQMLKTCVPVYNSQTDAIVVMGLGLDTGKWQEMQKNRTTTVKSSLLSFRIADIKFHDRTEYPELSITKK